MAILKRTKKKTEEVVVATKATVTSARDLTNIIIRPRITEKAGVMAEKGGVYVFEVHSGASKHDIALAVRELYNVTPAKIAVTRIPSKEVFVRGKWGVKQGGKKAYIYLKKGDKIDIM